MILDVRTLFWVVVVLAALQILIMVMLSLTNRNIPGLKFWTLGTIFNSFSTPLFLLQTVISSKVVTYFIPTMFVVTACVFLHLGACRFLEIKVWKKTLIVTIGLFLPVYLYYLFIDDNLGVRIQVTSIVPIIAYGITAYTMWNNKLKGLTLSTRFTAVSTSLVFIACTYRFYAWWVNPDAPWITGSAQQSAVLPMMIIIGVFMWTFCIIFLVNQRQTREIALSLDAQHKAEQELLEVRAEVERQRALRMRQMMARDLHDGIGGITATVAMLASLGKEETQEEKERLMLHIEKMALEGSREVRELMTSLESAVLNWKEWTADIHEHAAKITDAAGIQLNWRVSGDAPEGVIKDHSAATSLMRAIMEALHNMVRHAQTRTSDFELGFSATSLNIRLRDYGNGYKGPRDGGRGMRNMYKRLQELNGELVIHSAAVPAQASKMSQIGVEGDHDISAFQGTLIHMHLPLPLEMD